MLTADELPQAKKMLGAAAMTYVAALIVSFAQFLRILLRFSNKNRRR
ncbi:MAG: zinc metallopeptidase [Acutalibacteraceae bacterium]